MSKHLFSSPHDWLRTKIRKLQADKNVDELTSLVTSTLDLLDGDEIQDVFQVEMSDDGFFLDLETCDLEDCDPVSQKWPQRTCLEFLQQRLGISNPVSELGTQVDASGWRKIVQNQIDEQED